MSRQPSFSSVLKNIAILVTLLVVFSTVVAGVIDTKVRVNVLERDQGVLTNRLEAQRVEQVEQFEEVKAALGRLMIGQALLQQKIDSRFDEWKGGR